MHILNFSHPLTDSQIAKIEELTDSKIESIKEIKTQFDMQKSFAEQVLEIVAQIDFSPLDWQTKQILINPPSLNAIACVLLAELHGRMGYFPPIIRLRPVPDSLPPQFEVAEIINLNKVREQARQRR